MNPRNYFWLVPLIFLFFNCHNYNNEEKERFQYIETHKNIYQTLNSIDYRHMPTEFNKDNFLGKFAIFREDKILQLDEDLFIKVDKKFTTLNMDSLEGLVIISSKDSIVGKYENGTPAKTEKLSLNFYDLKRKVKFDQIDILGYIPPKVISFHDQEELEKSAKGREVMNENILFWIQSHINGKAIADSPMFK